MPIVAPGKRPAPRFAKSKVLGGKMEKGHRSTNAELNVVPMVDMMTMLVIFLLQQFSSTGEVLYMQKDIKLPTASMKLKTEPNAIIAQILIQLEAPAAEATAVVAGAAEPEVLTAKKPAEGDAKAAAAKPGAKAEPAKKEEKKK